MNSRFVHAKYLAVFLLAAVALLLVAFDAFSATEVNMGGETPINFEASQNIYRTERRYDYIESTCTREVSTGYHRVCSSGRTERKCRKVSGVGEECWNETEEVCSSEPSYRTETYSCRQLQEYSEQVFDHTVDARIEVAKIGAENFDLSKCSLIVSLTDYSEEFSARCLEAIVRFKILDRKVNGNLRDIKAELSFSSISELNALKAGNISLAYNKGIVSFASANLSGEKNYKLSAKLTRNRLLLKDKVLFNRDLKVSEISSKARDGGLSTTSFNLANLTGFEDNKKHTLNVVLSTLKTVDVKGAINTPKLENSVSATLVINE
jgi:hypothetical protein